jgi:hypothetical protein
MYITFLTGVDLTAKSLILVVKKSLLGRFQKTFSTGEGRRHIEIYESIKKVSHQKNLPFPLSSRRCCVPSLRTGCLRDSLQPSPHIFAEPPAKFPLAS